MRPEGCFRDMLTGRFPNPKMDFGKKWMLEFFDRSQSNVLKTHTHTHTHTHTTRSPDPCFVNVYTSYRKAESIFIGGRQPFEWVY